MLSFLKRLRRDKRGNVLILLGAAMPLVVGSAGLATDTIQWALWKRQLQRAADSAAMAAVYERVRANGATAGVPAVIAKDLQINQHTGVALHGAVTPSYPANLGNLTNQVEVTLSIQKPLSFSSMFMTSAPIITASARAASVPGSFNPCVISTERTTAMGIQGSGNGTIETDCPWMTNSTGNKSAVAKGSSTIIATVLASAGAIEQSANFRVGRYDAYVPQIPDPYAGNEYKPSPADMQCTAMPLNDGTDQATFYNSSTAHFSKNCFSSLSVGSNKTLTLPSNGTYYINGGGVNIQGTLNCSGCTIVLTNQSTSSTATIGSWDMNAHGQLNITAPTTGKYAGIAIYQDSRARDSGGSANNMPANSPNKINGNSSSRITGIVYFPNQQMTYNGNGDADWTCLRLVARRIQFSGNNRARLSTSRTYCAGTGVNEITGGSRVRLVA